MSTFSGEPQSLASGYGCSTQGSAPRGADEKAEMARSALAIATAVSHASTSRACGERIVQSDSIEVFALRAEHCLSCRDVGWMLRSRLKDSTRTIRTLAVAAPRADTALTCKYLEREGVDIAVLTVPDEALPQLESADAIIAIQISGKTHAFVHARTGDLVLKRLGELHVDRN